MNQRRKQPAKDATLDAYRRISALWLFRLLRHAHLPDQRVDSALSRSTTEYLLGNGGSADDGEGPFDDLDGEARNARKARRQVASMLQALEAEKLSLDDSVLGQNIATLGKAVGLDAVERGLLAYAVAITAYRPLIAAIGHLRLNGTHAQIVFYLSVILGTAEKPIHRALSADGALRQMRLVDMTADFSDLEGRLTAPEHVCTALLDPSDEPEDLLGRFFRPATPPRLGAADFDHLAGDLELLRCLLANAGRDREKGVNILLHGEPGTGKSEFARMLADAVGARLYEVGHMDKDGDPIGPSGRISSYVVCQRTLQRTPDSLVLFDEIEDVFPPAGNALPDLFGAPVPRSRSPGKAWVNRILESNPVPTLWISNRVQHMDPAYLRRFDLVLELPRPPAAQRRRIAEKYLGQTPVGAAWLGRLGAWEDLTPAQFEKAARVTRLVGSADAAEAERVAERVLRASARVLGQPPPPRANAMTGYDLAYANATPAPEGILAGLRRRPRGTFCFYGPPGTGKTALARHMAEALGRPLMVRRASDLLDMWVGESEKRIAEMFRRAADEGAVLVLDEADGLLADRRDARQSWEVTQVNEMLTWMEDFAGVFVCTTNLPDRLDAASLRRFDFKVRFDFMTPAQREALLRATWNLGDSLPADLAHRLAALDTLTPGDYAVVARQLALTGDAPTAERLVDALAEECRLKGHASKGIGFLA